jgi:hypothetical protein
LQLVSLAARGAFERFMVPNRTPRRAGGGYGPRSGGFRKVTLALQQLELLAKI